MALPPLPRRALLLTALLGCSSSPPPASPAPAPAAPDVSAAAAASAAPGDRVTDASRVIATARAGARACFQKGLVVDPAQEGRTAFVIAIRADGTVDRVDLTATGSLSAAVTGCIHDRLAALTFAPPEGGSATVTGSFTFQSASHPRHSP